MANQKDANNIEKTIVKARYWSFVCYPESAPTDWIERLQLTGLQFCVSPLHDKDIDPTGEPKKPHYHVILCYGGPVTFSNVRTHITEPLGQPHPQYLQSVKGMYRYLTHKDNADKYQYDAKDIKSFGGFSIDDYAQMTMSEEDRLCDTIEQVIYENKITEFCYLRDYLVSNGMQEQMSYIRRHTTYFEKLIKSLRHSCYFEKQNNMQVDAATGEVIEDDEE